MAEQPEPFDCSPGSWRGALRGCVWQGLCLQGLLVHTGRLLREGAICVISQRAPLNLSLIKQWQYGPDMKEPSLKRADCVGRNSLFNCSQGPAVGGTQNPWILPPAEQESGDE